MLSSCLKSLHDHYFMLFFPVMFMLSLKVTERKEADKLQMVMRQLQKGKWKNKLFNLLEKHFLFVKFNWQFGSSLFVQTAFYIVFLLSVCCLKLRL